MMLSRRSSLARTALFAGITACAAAAADRPNILFAIADDLSYPHMSAYGTTWVTTPAFDRVASQGILFQNGYTPNAKCGPSRASVLTGRQAWELGQIGNHIAVWPANAFRTYVEALADKGYHVGLTGKGWGPGVLESGSTRALTGRNFSERRLAPPAKGISANDYAGNFAEFLDAKAPDQPWCFWYGASEPHRHYEYGSGVRVGGKKTSAIEKVPGFLPDNETVRNDLLDYAFEIEHFDRHLGRMIALLEERGELENTLIVITADNGMPFPRAKGMQYEYSNHVPLAMMWPKGIRNPGRVESAFVSFVDFAPTFLKVAGVDWKDSGMEPASGKDLVELFEDGYRKQDRSYIVLGQERHDYGRPKNQGYPIRSIIQDGWLYIHNLKPDLWPAGNPETGYLNTDGSPTKTAILNLRRQGIDRSFWQLNFGKRPQEELYDLSSDPDCLINLATSPRHAELKERLRAKLFKDLARQADPRVVGPDGDVFDRYPFDKESSKDFWERYMRGGVPRSQTGWVNETDYEDAPIVEP